MIALLAIRHFTMMSLAGIACLAWLAGCGGERGASPEPDRIVEVIRNGESERGEVGAPTLSMPRDDARTPNHQHDPSASEQQRGATTPKPVQRTRIADDRPEVSEARLREQGIRLLKSKRLVLLTERTDDDVAALPALADALFERLERHFGGLPAAADGSEFQVTGHLIADAARFETAGLMPADGLTLKHGRHLNYEFWMRDQPDDYYRRHLLLHEFTHCFMTCESGMTDTPPAWYIEGMAEYFATHSLSDFPDGIRDIHFGVMPHTSTGFEGWGRIYEMRRAFDSRPGADVRRLKIPSLDEARLRAIPNVEEDSRYAWWWALCWLINEHPFYREHLAELSNVRRLAEFRRVIDRFEQQHSEQWKTDWLLVAESMSEGFDTRRSFPLHGNPRALPAEFSVAAESGWQDSGIVLQAGESVQLRCDGEFIVADDPVPWRSEPQGVSVEYVHGSPLGQIVGILVADDGSAISNRIAVGRACEVTAPWNCRLWLQVNDSADSREDNSGKVTVTVSRD